MFIPTFTPPIEPSSIKNTPKLKLLQASFGDGYSQTTRDGMNHMRTILTLEWEVLTPEQSTAIISFFEERGGDLPFNYAGKRFTCADWNESTGRANLRSISATFEQDFALR